MNPRNTDNKKVLYLIGLLTAAVIGMIVFVLIYGWYPLSVQNDAWIMAGYDESDVIQHYAGWLAFRNSPWAFPLGMAGDMAVGTGTIISFTDSIPWVAILFKLFRTILPETFQYFGIYALSCYILQSVTGYQLIYFKTENAGYSLISSILFATAPILMERSFRHTALGSQWMILMAILIWQKHRKQFSVRHYIHYLFLLVLAIGIHPYFLPMISVFLFLSVLEDWKRGKKRSVLRMIGILSVTAGFGVLLGVIGNGIETSRSGYGFYSMNLNALVNPSSKGEYTWSFFLKKRGQTLGNYDGFNYLGAGFLLGCFICAIEIIHQRMGHVIGAWIQRNRVYVLMMVFCALFAVTNTVTLESRVLFTIPIPSQIKDLCGIFRASSRMFYPVWYSLCAGMILFFWKFMDQLGKKRNAFLFLFLVLTIQTVDLHVCVMEKHRMMRKNASYESILNDETAASIFSEGVTLIKEDVSTARGIRTAAAAALKQRSRLYFSVANSGNYEDSEKEGKRICEEIRKNGTIHSYVIVTDQPETMSGYLPHETIRCYKSGELYFLYERPEN